ncbi:hypothetical protein BJV85_002855 [Clostridium acetobutylicum]|uniref:hypothetical protein n=1 Tax=Clostridium TaxID=1485 RepID=UPI000200A735|nr:MULTISPECIES: hypothetical protein [Clostridium]ADZ20193.1 Signal transduction protein containing diguanylate cyclase/phosphodiesterase domain (GGDEF) and domain (EAL) [Clostridium acetobutylicum EA 2018]AEI31651.1 Signal transduction protein [Clostridium acetobutylicum DSM 1731]AWV81630.1 histidine kinase [Clostridium acetobutylicum]MBC2393275.1 histidine kinase [Clostridium acetobutylicum]MBC2585821.1 histidine kinase [Clostridium acetobutylicum]
MKQLESLCSYHKDGNSFIIDKIYCHKKSLSDNRHNGNNSVYNDKLQLLITCLLAGTDDGTLLIPISKLLQQLKMINKDYIYFKNAKKELSKEMKINQAYIEDFYKYSYQMLKNALNKSLESLEKRKLIFYSKEILICYLDENNTCKYRLATDIEIKEILSAEKNTLEEMNCKSVLDVFLKKQIGIFNLKVINKLKFDLENTEYYFSIYKIISNKHHIIQALEEDKREEVEKSLNLIIQERIEKNTKVRRNKILKQRNNEWGTQILPIYQEIKESEEYIENTIKLIQKLIKLNK